MECETKLHELSEQEKADNTVDNHCSECGELESECICREIED